MVETTEKLPGIRKAAIFLISLGDQASAEIIRQLPEEDLRAVSAEIAGLDSVPPEQVEIVLQEFHERKTSGAHATRGGSEYVGRMLVSALGPGPAGRVLNQIPKLAAGTEDKYLNSLRQAEPQQLIPFIQNEHPQTIALILANLNPAQAGVLLMALAPEVRPQVALRMANLDRISPEVFNRIMAVVGGKLQAVGEVKRAGGARVVADMLNGIDPNAMKDIMGTIGESDTGLAETIQHLMFVFEDILKFGKEDVKMLLGKLDRKVLTLALKGTSSQLKDLFTGCMSQRGAEMLRDDMDALGPVRIKDVEAAQQQIIAMIQELQAGGQLSTKGSGDQYVA